MSDQQPDVLAEKVHETCGTAIDAVMQRIKREAADYLAAQTDGDDASSDQVG